MGIFTRSQPPGSAQAWLARLRCALARDLFVLHFQPIVAVADGRIVHHEALLRLADAPDGSLTAPAGFLPHAEDSGLICEIDLMVLEKALATVASRALPEAHGAPCVAVNLSALSVIDHTLLAHLEQALERHEVAPSQLVLELTETAAISDMRAARDFCAGALELGCAVALDDFGSGYGSFQYLKHLPFSHLKIDGEFIRRLPLSRTDQLVVEALAQVARGMGRQTIAECVGDRRTLELLRRFGVDYAQGYVLGRPRPILALAA